MLIASPNILTYLLINTSRKATSMTCFHRSWHNSMENNPANAKEKASLRHMGLESQEIIKSLLTLPKPIKTQHFESRPTLCFYIYKRQLNGVICFE